MSHICPRVRENSDGSSARPRESDDMVRVSKDSSDKDGSKSEDVKEVCHGSKDKGTLNYAAVAHSAGGFVPMESIETDCCMLYKQR